MLLIFCLFSLLFFCSLEITHSAWPNKLADYHVGHGVIRRRQYQSASIQYQDQLLWPHASAFPHIVNTALLLRKCSQHAATCPPHPPPWVSHPPLLKRMHKLLLRSGVTKGYVLHFTTYVSYWNTKCCLILIHSLRNVLYWTHWGLGGGTFWKRKSHLVMFFF